MITEVCPMGIVEMYPTIYKDERGCFLETYNWRNFNDNVVKEDFVQDNESTSAKYVVRGLHYQVSPYAQSKLVRVVKGRVIDLVLDLRKQSATSGKLYMVELNDREKNQLYIPIGFAHGFISLEDDTIFAYKCSEYYNKEYERGVNLMDESIGFMGALKEMGIDEKDLIISYKDMYYPKLSRVEDWF